jgi:hypothetical protein
LFEARVFVLIQLRGQMMENQVGLWNKIKILILLHINMKVTVAYDAV